MWFLLACKIDPLEVGRPRDQAPRVTPPAAPPPAPTPTAEKLYQVLYAGELGPLARPAGDEVRARAFLDLLALSKDQHEALVALSLDVARKERASQAALASLAEAEAAALGPIYAEMNAAWGVQPPTEAALAAWAERLLAARAALYDPDPRARRYAEVRAALEGIVAWVGTLSPAQRATLNRARFLLARELGPFANPGDYGLWSGSTWGGGEFAALKVPGAPADEGHLDIGGLWISEEGEVVPDRAALQNAILVFVAVQQVGFRRALGVTEE